MKILGLVRAVFITCLFIAYPYLVYQGMDAGLVWLAPMLGSIFYVYHAYHSKNPKLKVIKLLIASVLLIGAFFLQSVTAKLIPIFIQLMMMFFFGRTLFSGSPLVERFVRYDYPELPDAVLVYARQLTWIWTVFFGFNALMCAVLAIWASNYWWAIYNGVMIYTLTLALMIGEYIYRHYRFPDWEIPTLASTVRNITVNSRNIWKEGHE